MLSISNLNIQYGKKHLFKNVSAMINPLDRIGLVGVNGAGKSTLLQIAAGITETDHGVVTRTKSTTVGYLPQETTAFPPGRTLYKEAEASFGDIISMQRELDGINLELATADPASPDFADLLQQQGEIQFRLDQADIFRMKSKIEKVLVGLGFSESDFNRDCHTFSGGWLMRLHLSKLLLAQPSILLLDEPTNHLDIESLTWLEDFLKTYHGALAIISHDRAFLDNITAITWEISLGKLTAYKGNYSKYLAEKELRMEVQSAAYENQQAKIRQTMRFVERFRAKSTKAKQVQSRVKQLAKMDRIELEGTEQRIMFRFPPAAPSGRMAVAVKGLSKSFDGKPVFTNLSFEMQRGDKMAVVGVNGAGKSTLVRLLAGLNKPDMGAINYGHNVLASYFGQHQAQELPTGHTVLETMSFVTGEKTITWVRSLLGAFLFRGDDVDKKVQVLSGGEKSRLALAKMIAVPANLLIMDEPTNHLDMMSQDILQEALLQYDGSIIIVSHNRYFLDKFVNKVLEIKNGRAFLYQGNITDYLARVKQDRMAVAPQKAENQNSSLSPSYQEKQKGKKARQLQAKQRQEKSKKIAPFRKTVEKTERDIETLETRKMKLEQEMADPGLYKDEQAFSKRSKEYKDLERRLERYYKRWEEAQEKIEKIENAYAQNSEGNSCSSSDGNANQDK